MTLAPPSSFGADISSVADPSIPIATEVIIGAKGGPRGLCHSDVVCVFELQAEILRIICRLERLLTQVLRSNRSEPGVPDGAAPF